MIREPIALSKLLATDNIATLLSDDDMIAVARTAIETYKADDSSLKEQFSLHKEYIEMYLQKRDVESAGKTDYAGKSRSFYPLLYKVCQTFTSLAFPALIKGNSIVKCGVLGNDSEIPVKEPTPDFVNFLGTEDSKNEQQQPPLPSDLINQETGDKQTIGSSGLKRARAMRVSEFVNYILFNKVDSFVEDFDKQLTAQCLLGYMISKVYYCDKSKKIVRDVLYPNDVIFNAEAKSLSTNTVTQIRRISTNEIYENIRRKLWTNIEVDDLKDGFEGTSSDYNDNSNDNVTYTYPSDHYKEFLEQHTWLDLDDDGYLEPYIILIKNDNKSDDGKIVNITKRYTDKSITYLDKSNKKVVMNIEPQVFFYLYPFENNPDGSLLAIGYGSILYNLQHSINALLNSIQEASVKGNITSYVASAGSIPVNSAPLVIGDNSILQLKNNMGIRLADSLMQIPRSQPSPISFQALDYLVGLGNQMQHGANITPESLVNTSATAIMSGIEEGLRSFKAVYKRIRNVLTSEIMAYFKLIKENEGVFSSMYQKVLDDSTASFKRDFNLDDLDIQPTADIESITKVEKMAEATFLLGMIQYPHVNTYEIMKRIMEASGVAYFDKLLSEPRPDAPTPQEQIAQQQQQLAQQKMQADMVNTQARIAEVQQRTEELRFKALEVESKIKLNEANSIRALAEAESKEAGIQLDAYKAQSDNLVNLDNVLKSNNNEGQQ